MFSFIKDLFQSDSEMLHKAVIAGDVNKVRYLLNRPDVKTFVNLRDKEGNTPLHHVTRREEPFAGFTSVNHLTITDLLINAHADVNAILVSNNIRLTPLFSAILQGHTEVAKKLITSGANVNSILVVDNKQFTPLFCAINEGNIEIARELIKNGADVNCISNIDNMHITPLFIAIQDGHTEIVEELLENGADINNSIYSVEDDMSFTPLSQAIFLNNEAIAKILLTKGANINRATIDGKSLEKLGFTFLMQAAAQGSSLIVNLLLDKGENVNSIAEEGSTALHCAIDEGKLEIVKILLNNGANINLANHNGSTPLIVAVKKNNIDIVKLLLDAGAKKNATKENKKASDIARELGSFDIEELILNHSNMVEMTADEHDKWYKSLSGLGCAKIVETLIRKGDDVNHINSQGVAPIHYAAQYNELSTLIKLVENFANVDLQTANNGQTALIIAVQHGHVDIVRELIGANADVNLAMADETTPLMAAVERNNIEIVKLLLDAGANISATRRDEKALDIARKLGYKDIESLIFDKTVDEELGSLLGSDTDAEEEITQETEADLDGEVSQETEENSISNEQETSQEEFPIEESPVIEAVSNIEIPADEIQKGKRLGEGGSAKVYQGTYKNITVAIKRPKEMPTPGILEEFKKEAKTLRSLNSPYIIQFYGICFYEEKFSLVMELAEQGSLFSLYRKQSLEWSKRMSIATDIANGIAYLHAGGIIHRDLKSPNVFITATFAAKLGDFGFAKSMHSVSSQSSSAMGSLRWVAPETVDFKKFGYKKPVYDKQSDMFSYGVLLFEIAENKLPFEEVRPEIVAYNQCEGERDEVSTHYFSALIQRCWAQRREERPTAAEVLIELQKIKSDQERATKEEVDDLSDELGLWSYKNKKFG